MVDAIRGFALAGIVILHNLEHFLIRASPEYNPLCFSAIDPTMRNIISSLFSGKAYGVFSLLFGFSFWIQYESQQKRGYSYTSRFAWRMVLLLGLGILNRLFYLGDVLSIYALMSIVLILTRNWSNRRILFLVALLLLQPVDIARTIYSYYHPEYELVSNVWHLSDHLKEIQINGPFHKMMLLNVSYGYLNSVIWNWEFGRAFQTPALFLIGMLAARKRWFSEVNPRFWLTLSGVSLLVAIPIHCLSSLLLTHIHRGLLLELATNLTGLYLNLPVMTFMLSLMVLIWHYIDQGRKVLAVFAPFGRMSLTNYIAQSIIGTTLYMGYSLGLYRYCGPTLSFAIGAVTLGIQLFWSHWWLKRFNQGPLEFLWKKGTWVGHKYYRSIHLVKQPV